MTTVNRRYGRRFTIALLSYAVLLVVALRWTSVLPADSPLRFVAIALPIPAVFGIGWAVYRYVMEADEMISRNLVRSLAIGFAGGSLATFTYGMFQFVGAPMLNWTFVFPLYAVCWAVGAGITSQSTR